MWHVTCDTWQVTHDMRHVTCDMLWGVTILSKFQLPNSFGLLFMIFWRLGGKGSLNEWIKHEADCRTAPATLGLLKSYIEMKDKDEHFKLRYKDWQQKAEDLILGTKYWILRTEDWGLRTEDWGMRTEEWGMRNEDWGLRTADWGLRREDGGLRTKDWGLSTYTDKCTWIWSCMKKGV